MRRTIQPHLTDSIIMVRPIDFGFNEQTGQDNEFQNRSELAPELVREKANQEFNQMVATLKDNHINVTVLEKTHTQESLPDAVFPNNWFSTRTDGSLFIYPMKTLNRQAEVQIEGLSNAVSDQEFQVKQVLDLRDKYGKGVALEGTGSLIFHHLSGQLFAAVSERCELKALKAFAEEFGYQLHWFESQSDKGFPIYHTNVLMSCGDKFAVIAEEVLKPDAQSKQTMEALRSTVDDVIVISEAQMSDSFCGNIIQLKNSKGEPCIVMSGSAMKGFTASQIAILEKHGQLIACDIPTIEFTGGGSARCMIGENFLPR